MKRKILQFLVFSAIFLCSFSSVRSVRAETLVADSEISTSTTWTKANSPYVVENDLDVLSGVTLTIEPGVIVKMDGSALYVDGKIIAEGTESDKIYFTSLKDDSLGGDTNGDGTATEPGEFDYDGIRLWGSDPGSHFFNVVFRYSSEALDFDTTNAALDTISIGDCDTGISTYATALTVTNSTIAHLGYDGIDGSGASTITIASSTIEDVGGSAVGMYQGSALILKNSMIKDVSWGNGLGIYNSSADVNDTTFENIAEQGVGVYNSKLTFNNSSIKNVDWGSAIYAQGTSDIRILGSLFDGGFDSGVTFYGSKPSSLSVTDSTFRNFFGWAGISAGDLTSGNIASSTIENNFTGLDVWRTPFLINGNSIKNNDLYGLWSETKSGVDARENWWGDATGPSDILNDPGNPYGLGDMVFGPADYSPWLTEDPFLPKTLVCCSSVAFLPGIEASRLYRDNFGGLNTDQLWEPNWYTDVEALDLDANGKSKDPSIYTKYIINKVNVIGTKIYQSFSDEMDRLKTAGTIANWEPLPYDWRLSAQDTIANPIKLADGKTYSLVTEIEHLAKNSKTGKVTLIAHSMGGVVGKALIKALDEKGEANLIDKFIMVAVPEVGTPKAISSLLHGYDEQLGFGVIAGVRTMRTFAENMPGAYQLLPSSKYFEKVTDPVITFDPAVDSITNFRQTFGDTISDATKLKDFLLGVDGRAKPAADDVSLPNILNSTVLMGANSLHDDIDSYQIPSDITVTQIAGWGLNTIKGIKYQTKDVTICADKGACQTNKELDMRPISTEEGDDTVVAPSATDMSVVTYYINLNDYNGKKHADVLEVQPILDFVENQIKGVSTLPSSIITTKPVSTSNDKRINVSGHSPISLDLYDNAGKHTGLISIPNSDFNYDEEQIPNSYYFELGDGKYVGFPDDNSTSVKITGTGIGTFTLEIERTVAGQTVATSTFADIPVLPTTQATLSVSATSTLLGVDLDGNGTTDFSLTSAQEFDPIQYLQVMKNVVGTFTLDKGTRQSLLNKIDTTIKMLQKGKAKGISARISGFLNGIKKDKIMGKKMSLTNEQMIVSMLNTLLDNLKTQ
ncbi:MAG: right-handed parallel beta-helix repeat-containing protein [Candidatus Pacebacteria bacterium]|nr:right-handed parallel beta-helix repeat-containing protein [Candidatus Paceibacterota bacterium]